MSKLLAVHRRTLFTLSFSGVAILLILALGTRLNATTQAFTEDVTVTTNSNAPDGSPGNVTKISSDGRYVYFISNATNLVANDTNNVADLFVRDRLTNTTKRLNVSNSGQQDNGGVSGFDVSDGGRYIVFSSAGNTLVTPDYSGYDIYLYDSKSDQISILYRGGQFQNATRPSISGDGKWVAFAAHLWSQPYNDGSDNIYLKNRQTGQMDRISNGLSSAAANQGSSDPDLNYDGSVLAFNSAASNLVSGDTNNQTDVFIWKRASGTISRISVSSSGTQANNYSQWPRISNDGNRVAFDSYATNMVASATAAGQLKVMLHEIDTATTSLINVSTSNTESNDQAYGIDISKDGEFVAFNSAASNLISGDTNGQQDMFVRNIESNSTVRVSVDSSGNQISSYSILGNGISADGQYAAFRDDNYQFLKY